MLNMRMNRYWIENINYSLDIDLYINRNKEISIIPELQRLVDKVDGNKAIVKLFFRVKKTDVIPFDINVTICGLFECDNWETTQDGLYFINTTSTQILFPYLRQAISTITGMSNIAQYVLPVVNVSTLFRNEVK